MAHSLRIALSGSHGVGKTTVFDMLEYRNKIRETARETMLEMFYTPNADFDGGSHDPDSVEQARLARFQRKVLSKQLSHEETYDGGFITDRSVYDILSYTFAFIEDGNIYASIVGSVPPKKRYDIVFFFPIEFEMHDDVIRGNDRSFQREMEEAIMYRLRASGENVVVVTGDANQRLQQINDAIAHHGS